MDQQRITPAAIALLWRILGIGLPAAVWLRGAPRADALILVLLLSILAIARWRFPRMPAWTVLLDQAACGAALLLWPDAVFGLALPAFEVFAVGAPWLGLPILAIVTAAGAWSLPLAAVLAAGALAGWAVRLWAGQLDAARRDADRDRRDRYDMEGLKEELLSSNVRSARMAELAERARIARDLHDHAGHELTAAHLALQAYGKLRESGDLQAEEMLEQARRRVGEGLDLLRTTVHGLAPSRAVGLGAFEEICRRFTVCRVGLEVHGNTERIPVHVWSVLEPCLKEALANGIRHVGAERIDVSLDVGPHIARLSVRNGARAPGATIGAAPGATIGAAPGATIDAAPADVGSGLRNLRQRAHAVGGSVTIDASDGFRLVCVLPLEDVP